MMRQSERTGSRTRSFFGAATPGYVPTTLSPRGARRNSYEFLQACTFRSLFFLHVLICSDRLGAIFGNHHRRSVKDATGGVMPGASVEISDPCRAAITAKQPPARTEISLCESSVQYLPPGGKGIGIFIHTQDVDVRSSVPAAVEISLKLGAGIGKHHGGGHRRGPGGNRIDVRTLMWTANSSTSCRWKAHRPRSVRWLRWPRPEWWPIPTAYSTGWATTRKILFPWTANRLPTNRAKFSPTSFPSIPFNRWKSFPVRRPRNTETRPAWSSKSRRVPGSDKRSPRAA